MTTAKQIGWVLITSTAVVTIIGGYIPELGVAVTSLLLGGSALAVSLVARAKLAGHSVKEGRMRTEPEALA